MRPDGVVIVTPERQLASGTGQAVEDFLVQQLVAQAAVERLDKRILLRLARVDVMPLNTMLLCPVQNGATGELGAVTPSECIG